MLVIHVLKTKKNTKSQKPKIYNKFIKTNLIKLAFNMTWLMEILSICLEGQLLIWHYMIKHFILLKNQNMMDIKEVLLSFLIKISISVVVLKMKNCQIKNKLINYTRQLWKQFEKRKVNLSFIENIWGANLADMWLLSKSNKTIRFFMCYWYLL